MQLVRWATVLTVFAILSQAPFHLYGQTGSVEGETSRTVVINNRSDSGIGCGNVCSNPGCHGCYECCQPPYQRGFGFGPALREALRPADQPYFGLQPLLPQREFGYGHAYQARFPRLRAVLVPEQMFMSTKPAPPMKTYTTRGPRDFLNPNPPSIGY